MLIRQPGQNIVWVLIYGLTRKIFIDMNLLSSRSALAGFSCSKPPLNPIKLASSKFVEAFLYRMHRLKSTIS
jgi:hypothetical protein